MALNFTLIIGSLLAEKNRVDELIKFFEKHEPEVAKTPKFRRQPKLKDRAAIAERSNTDWAAWHSKQRE